MAGTAAAAAALPPPCAWRRVGGPAAPPSPRRSLALAPLASPFRPRTQLARLPRLRPRTLPRRQRALAPFARKQDESEESAQRDWLFEITELLLTGGYFRARLASVAPFDKARARGRPPPTAHARARAKQTLASNPALPPPPLRRARRAHVCAT